MENFWRNRKVLVTGAAGFIASHAVEQLVEKGAKVTAVDNLSNGNPDNLDKVIEKIDFLEGDLMDVNFCLEISKRQECIMNLAAMVGGISFNKEHPGTMFWHNAVVALNMLEAARKNNVERFQVISSACVYPRFCTIPTPEEEGFDGIPEPTNYGYGWAKRMAEVQAYTYAGEYKMNISIVRPYNCYGPRDHFEPLKAHVIPALIKRVFDNENPLKVWGDGEQSRSFIYVEDLARGMIEAVEKYPQAQALNLGAKEEIKIKDLIKMILDISGKKPEVIFDTSKPAGQPRRNCDNTKALEKIGFEAGIGLEEGLKKTILWYKEKGKNNK